MKVLRIAYQVPLLFLKDFVPPEVARARHLETNPMNGFNTDDAEEWLARTIFKEPAPGKGTDSFGPQ